MNIFWKEMCMEKVRKKLIREKAVIAVYQYLLTNSTEEEIMNYLNECYKPRMDEREIELCKEIVFNTIERIDEYVPLIEKNLKKFEKSTCILPESRLYYASRLTRPVGQGVKTSPSHGENTSSILVLAALFSDKLNTYVKRTAYMASWSRG